MAVWYYSVKGQQQGPVDEPQIRAMAAGFQLAANDLVWCEGMPQWVSAAQAGIMPPLAAMPAIPMAAVATGTTTSGYAPQAVIPLAAGAQATPATPMQLSYAAPTITELPMIGHDEGPFLKLGKQFSIPTGPWRGLSIASPRAFYLLKISRVTNGYAYGAGELAGMLLANAFSNPDDMRTCDLNDLPHPVRMALDPKRKGGNVIVLPKESIRLVKTKTWNNVVRVAVGAEKFVLNRGIFTRGKVRAFLTNGGWTLDQEVMATAAPIHGNAYGRAFEEIGKNRRSTAKRVLYAIVGIVIFLMYVFIRVMANYH